MLCAETGHINVHETGAVEATGHKALALPAPMGKNKRPLVREAFLAHVGTLRTSIWCARHGLPEHPTRLGTLYSQDELEALYAVTREYGLRLFIDGARLSYGLAADRGSTCPFLSRHCDAFTLGGTKCGALFGRRWC